MFSSAVLRILGVLLVMFSTTMIPPLIISWMSSDGSAGAFLVAYLATVSVGGALWILFRNKTHYARPAPLDWKPTDVNQLVVDTVDLFLQAEDKVVITTRLEKGSEAVVLDPNAFRQVLNNVIINAQDAFPDRTGEIIISMY